jgi:hypothetical protein
MHHEGHHLCRACKIVFTIKDKKEKFSFKNRMLHSPTQPQAPYKQEESVLTKKRRTIETRRRIRLAIHRKRLSR